MSTTGKQIGRFFKHSIIYAIGNIINRIGAFLLLPIYTNYLTVAEYGSLEYFYTVSTIMTGLLSAGIAHSTLRFYFEYQDQQDRNSLVITNIMASFGFTVFGVLIASLFSTQAVTLMFGSTEYLLGFYIMLAIIVFELSSQVSLAYVRAEEHSVFFVVIAIAKLVIQVAVNTYLVVFADMGIVGVLIGNFCAVFLGWIILTTFVVRKCGIKADAKKILPVMKYAYPFLLATMVGVFAETFDRIILKELISVEALGLFALAVKFSLLLEALIGEPFNRSYGSFRFSIMKDGNAAEIQEKIVRMLAVILVFTGSGLLYFSPIVIKIMSDSAFWPAIKLLPILVLASCIKIATYSCQTGFLYAKKSGYIFRITIVQSAFSIVGSLVLIQLMGIIGACLAQLITAIVVIVVTHRASKPFLDISYNYGKISLAALVGGLYFFIWWILQSESLIASLAINSVLTIALFFSLIRLPILTVSERGELLDKINRFVPWNLKPIFGIA